MTSATIETGCPVILKTGDRKGQVCGKPSKFGLFCGRHKEEQSLPVASEGAMAAVATSDNDEQECDEVEPVAVAAEAQAVVVVPLSDNPAIVRNTFITGDNLDLLRQLNNTCIDMIYFDPPYNTGRDFHYFNDRIANFVPFLEERIVECHRVLKTDGNIIIHVEPRISHFVRMICDRVFGEDKFRNEIVWHSGGNAKNLYQLGRNHDTIIVYAKSASSKFFPLYKPYSDEYKRKAKMCSVHKKLYITSSAHNSQPEVNPRPNLRYEWKGHTKQWFVSKERMKALDNDNRLEYNAEGIPRIKRFIDEMQGVPIRDTWDDISNIQKDEKTRYATQKPVKLLERIVSLYSREGEICLDPFGGSGTLGRACINLKRNYLLFDINPEAKEVFAGTTS
jgi:DNA modification methylase